MQLVLLACLVVVAAAAPQLREYEQNYPIIEILRDERDDRGDGNFRYEFETANGILTNAIGTPGSQGQSNIEGFFSFPLDDGSISETRYTADERGYLPEGTHIHPLPDYVIDQIRFAEEQRAQGVRWDQQGFIINK